MLCRAAWTGMRRVVALQAQRNFGVSAPAAANLDPIQQLFVDKIREYSQKSKAAGGKLVDATADQERNLQDQLEKVDRVYEAKGQDMTQFPTFSFPDPTLEPVSLGLKGDEGGAGAAGKKAEVGEVEEDNRAYFDI